MSVRTVRVAVSDAHTLRMIAASGGYQSFRHFLGAAIHWATSSDCAQRRIATNLSALVQKSKVVTANENLAIQLDNSDTLRASVKRMNSAILECSGRIRLRQQDFIAAVSSLLEERRSLTFLAKYGAR